MAQKKKAAPIGDPKSKRAHCITNQRQRIYARLEAGETLTTWDIHQMGIMAAATRVMELRSEGHKIVCVWETMQNQFGQTIRRGRYSLVKGAKP